MDQLTADLAETGNARRAHGPHSTTSRWCCFKITGRPFWWANRFVGFLHICALSNLPNIVSRHLFRCQAVDLRGLIRRAPTYILPHYIPDARSSLVILYLRSIRGGKRGGKRVRHPPASYGLFWLRSLAAMSAYGLGRGILAQQLHQQPYGLGDDRQAVQVAVHRRDADSEHVGDVRVRQPNRLH